MKLQPGFDILRCSQRFPNQGTRFLLRTIIGGFLLCSALSATITEVQQVTGSAQSGGNLCPVTGTSCAVTVAPTGAGNVLVAIFELQASGSTVSAVTGGGTWVHAPNCAASDQTGINVDCWYALNSTAGATTITGTVTAGSGRGVEFYELSATAGCTTAFDSSGFGDITTTVVSQLGVALALHGLNDAIIQGIFDTGNVSAIGSNYALSSFGGAANRQAALLLNTSSGVAPAWTVSNRVTAVVDAIAISESCPVSSVTVGPAGPVSMSANQVQQFTATVTGLSNTGVNTAVTWTISPPGTGSITASGVYTAPASIAAAQNVTVKATSADNAAIFGTATVSLDVTNALPGGTFTLNELFGVAWPDQPIEFRYDGGPPPASTRMLGPTGAEVPYQWVSGPSCSDPTAVNGCIVVRSNLPANASYTWILQTGTAPTATVTNPVQINQRVSLVPAGTNYELTNGLTGVRIASLNLLLNLAPIQGVQLPDGTWTGAGVTPNFLYEEAASGPGGQAAGCVGCLLHTLAYQATGYTVTVVDSGPLKTVVSVNYTFNRPQYQYGGAPAPISTAGAGHYTMLVTLYANSKSVLIDEDTDMQLSWYLPVNAQVHPDTARWRGHDSVDINGNPNPACGYEQILTVTGASASAPIVITTSASGGLTNGQAVQIAGVGGIAAANGTYYAKTTGFGATQFALYSDQNLTVPVIGAGAFSGGGTVKPAYRGQSLNTVSDALQDLTYTADRPALYLCSAGNSPSYEKLLTAYPASSHSAGWYVEMYNSAAGGGAPVVGFYIGRGSKQVYSAVGPSQPGIYTSNNHWITSAPAAGIQVDTLLRGPDGSTICGTAPLPCNGAVHRNWGIFASTQADLLPTGAHQPIADEQNELTGINLSRLYTYQLVYNDPPGGWQPLYLSAAGVAQLQSLVQNGTAVCGSPTCYATLLSNSEGSPAGRALVAMWQATTPAAAQSAIQSALTASTNLAAQLEHALAAGDNRFDLTLGYYGLGLQSSPFTVVLNAILTNPNATTAQKTMAKAELALFGSIFWDNDWFPIDNKSGSGTGLANQYEQYLQYRTQSVLADPSQPFLSLQLATALGYATADFGAYFSPTGAAAGSTHYQSAFFEPLILNYMNSGAQGQLSMADPKWAAYANWELSIQTPPEPRFGNLRKGYSNGDGNTEADVRTGMLGTAMNATNPALASNLMWAWQQSNAPGLLTEDSQFVTTLAAIDPSIPAVPPHLASTNIPGYHSVERHNFGTPQETALWFINGGFYQTGGHRHYDDGQVSIYALSAPLAIDWNANLYSPETPGRFMHNSIVYDSELSPRNWSDDQPDPALVSTLFRNPTNTEFAAFKRSTTSTATFLSSDGTTTWARTVRTLDFDSSYPIIYVSDTFSEAGAGTGKTLTWNLMATGAVQTPAGAITPTTRFSAGCQSPAGALPSNGLVNTLPQGVGQFKFTGQTWPAHATQGIDWDLYTVSNDATGQFLIGNWGHGCHSTSEIAEYLQINGAPFAETQHILRVHGNGGFTTVMLPNRKGEARAHSVTQQACGTQVIQGSEITCFNASAVTHSRSGARLLTVYDSSTQSAYGLTATGGAQEVAVESDHVVWTLGGVQAGPRSLTLPGNWYPFPAQGVTRSGDTWTYNFAGLPAPQQGADTVPAQPVSVTITFSQVPLP